MQLVADDPVIWCAGYPVIWGRLLRTRMAGDGVARKAIIPASCLDRYISPGDLSAFRS